MANTKPGISFSLSKYHVFELLGAIVIAVAAGLVFRYVFFSPYVVTDQSMYPTLQSGDRVLTNKFTQLLKMGNWTPEVGELVTYSHPLFEGEKAIKRIIATSGDTIHITGGKAFVNNVPLEGMDSQTAADSIISPFMDPRQKFEPLIIPHPGDTLYLENLGVREFQFSINLIRQEQGEFPFELDCTLMLNEKEIPDSSIGKFFKLTLDTAKNFSLDSLSWIDLANLETQLSNRYPKDNISFQLSLYRDGKIMEYYVLREKSFFVMGDNWNESYDSRYFGAISRNNLMSKPFIVFWSHEPNQWYKINFKRILKIVT